jgi:hypothetical protein
LAAERETLTVPEAVVALVDALPKADYLKTIQGLNADQTATLSAWLAACPAATTALLK